VQPVRIDETGRAASPQRLERNRCANLNDRSTGCDALGRLGTPADVASLIEWLLQDESSWITGQVFDVDGGLATLRTTPR